MKYVDLYIYIYIYIYYTYTRARARLHTYICIDIFHYIYLYGYICILYYYIFFIMNNKFRIPTGSNGIFISRFHNDALKELKLSSSNNWPSVGISYFEGLCVVF